MRLVKFLSLSIIVTTFSLLYVYQQSEIFHLAYLGQKTQSVYNELFDKNTVLKYNVKRNSSLVRIGNKVSENQDFQMPDSYRLVKFVSLRSGGLEPAVIKANSQTLLSRLFSVKREAQAKTINP